MQMSEKGLLALANREAIALDAYQDSEGVWTIGLGHTAAAGAPFPAKGMRLTIPQAIALARKDVAKYERDVDNAVTVPVSQHEFDALVSFHFNTGGIGRASLVNSLNRGNRVEAAERFMLWSTPSEIIGRRRAEQAQFAKGAYGDVSHVPILMSPGRVTRVKASDIFPPLTQLPPKLPPEPKPAPPPPTPPKPLAPKGLWSRFTDALRKRFTFT